jgi:hypothetical protein
MARSYISYHNENVRVNDFDLIALIFLFKGSASQVDRKDVLGPMFATWIDSIENDGAGNIDLRLDLFLTSSEHVGVLRATLHKVQEELAELPEVLGADFLRTLIEVDGIEFGNYKKVFLENIAVIFDRVLNSHDCNL